MITRLFGGNKGFGFDTETYSYKETMGKSWRYDKVGGMTKLAV
jgi:hypothetical protein